MLNEFKLLEQCLALYYYITGISQSVNQQTLIYLEASMSQQDELDLNRS